MKKKELSQLFVNPGNEYRGKPFWSWNGELREDEVRRQIGIMQEMGFGGYFMHSRTGLITEYLGKEWFDLINAGADEGEARGMEAWLYDEDRWPSGSAGGKVTKDPEYRMKSLVIREEAPDTFKRTDDMIFVFAAKLDGIDLYGYYPVKESDNVQEVIDKEETESTGLPGVWKILSFTIVPDRPSSNYNGTTYIDTMSEKATKRFIELTHKQYKASCGDRLGRSIKGIFTDEPHRGHAMDNRVEKDGVVTCSMSWTDDILEEFKKRYGYNAETVLPELFYRPWGERFAPVKHDYFDLANNLFIERFAKPIQDWCNENNIIFTGHVLHEDSLTNQAVPNGSLMRFYQYMGYPGIDVLAESNINYWNAKQLASAARQTGKKWMLSELYGCTGWQMSLKGHKAVGDWQALFGVNLRCPHLSWYTMEGESKRDYPASILHQSTWYPYYNAVESYFARFGALMTEGKPVCDVLVLNAIESAWSQSYIGWTQWIHALDQNVKDLEEKYRDLFRMLTGNHIDFDYGEEQMMEELASIGNDENGTPVLKVGASSYHVVVVGGMETIRKTTIALLEKFISAGGHVVFTGDVPSYVNAVPSEEPAKLAETALWVPFEAEALVNAVRAFSENYVSVISSAGKPENNVFVQLRDYGDSFGFVILNTDRKHEKSEITVKIACKVPLNCEFWDMESGKRYNANALTSYENGFMSIHTSLPAAGTKAFVLSEKADISLPICKEEKKKTTDKRIIKGDFKYEINEKNICVLDFARWKWQDGDWSEETEILKADRQVRDSVGIGRRGGQMLQPWFSKLNDTKEYGDLTVEYTFDIDTLPQTPVFLAGERPERMDYYVNGIKLLKPDIHDIWIDDCFKRMEIPSSALHTGTNSVTVKTSFMRTTNLEALYLIGDFGVRIDGHKRTLTVLPEMIGNGNLDTYALPFYTGEVTYLVTPDMYESVSTEGQILLSPEKFTGSLLKVEAEGMPVKLLCWDPYTADVTEAIREKKTLRVTVVGTRRNLFGPLHLVPVIQNSYGPVHFVTEGQSWSDDYKFVDSALTGIILEVVN